jgi:hypothetical protein
MHKRSSSRNSQTILSDALIAALELTFDTELPYISSHCLRDSGLTFNLGGNHFTFDAETMMVEETFVDGHLHTLVGLKEDKLFSAGDASGEEISLNRYGWINLFDGSKSLISTSDNTYSICKNGSYNNLMKDKTYKNGIPEIMDALDKNYNYEKSVTQASSIEDATWSLWGDGEDLSGISAQLSVTSCELIKKKNFGLINDSTLSLTYCNSQKAPDGLIALKCAKGIEPPDISINDLTYAGYEWNNGDTVFMYSEAPRNGGEEYNSSTITTNDSWGASSYFNSCLSADSKFCNNLSTFTSRDNILSIVSKYTNHNTGSGFILNPLDENNGKIKSGGKNIIPLLFGHGIAPFQYPGTCYLFRIKNNNDNDYVYLCVMMVDQATASLEIGTDDYNSLKKLNKKGDLDFKTWIYPDKPHRGGLGGAGFNMKFEFRLVDNNPYSIPTKLIEKYNLNRYNPTLLEHWFPNIK